MATEPSWLFMVAPPTGWEDIRIFKGNSNLNGIAGGEFDTFHTGTELALLQGVGKL